MSGASEEEMAAMFTFFNGEAYEADIPALREVYPGLLTFEQYLRKHGWENAEPIPIGRASLIIHPQRLWSWGIEEVVYKDGKPVSRKATA